MEVKFVYSEIYDLIFHFLAHMRVENASDLYSESYIYLMQQVKNMNSNIVQDASELSSYYNSNFERLGMINFLPFYCSDFQSLKDLLLHYSQFRNEDKELFLYPFLRSLESENAFYSNYWKQIFYDSHDKQLLIEAYIKEELKKYNCLFEYFNKSTAVVCFSFSLTRNGRGIGNDKEFMAIVPFPWYNADYQGCIFTLLHEYTHQFTDSLIGSSISMMDGSHDLSENVVVLFDYYLLKALNETDIQAYCSWFIHAEFENVTALESKFLSIYKVPDSLNDTLKSLVNDIIENKRM